MFYDLACSANRGPCKGAKEQSSKGGGLQVANQPEAGAICLRNVQTWLAFCGRKFTVKELQFISISKCANL